MDLISVVVPIYKAEKYINRCVASIAAQTYSNLEIILVDDGSPDSCPKICDNWTMSDSRVKVIHCENGGVSAARNIGIRNSSGRYIMQVDSDDYISENTISVLYDALIQNEADLSICGFEKGKEENYSFSLMDVEVEVITPECAFTRIYESDEKALQYVVPWAKLYKRELFEGLRYLDGKIFEDIYLTHQILNRCNTIAVLPQKMVYYFQHSNSIMNTEYHVGKLDYLEACKDRISFFKNNGYENLAQRAYDEYLHALIWEYSRAKDLLANREVMKDIINRFRSEYVSGYESKHYPQDTKTLLRLFAIHPEIIMFYWKINAKLKSIFR